MAAVIPSQTNNHVSAAELTPPDRTVGTGFGELKRDTTMTLQSHAAAVVRKAAARPVPRCSVSVLKSQLHRRGLAAASLVRPGTLPRSQIRAVSGPI